MGTTTIYAVTIQFGDCDPAGIVFYPNFLKWMDAASLHFFTSHGVLPWRELVKTTGIIGTPLLEIGTRFLRSATYGESIEVHTSIAEWRAMAFIQRHEIYRHGELLCEGTETRVFAVRDATDGNRLRAIAVPEDIKTKCTS